MQSTSSGTFSQAGGTIPSSLGHSIVSLTTLATVVVVCVILYVAKDLFLPLALGMLVAFVLTPVVTFLRRRGLRDTPAVILTVLGAASLVAAFVLVLAIQLSQIASNLPQYQGNVLGKIDGMLQAGEGSQVIAHLQTMVENILARLEGGAGATNSIAQVEVVDRTGVKDWITGVIIPALSPVAIFGLIFVVVVFALLERASLRERLVQLIGGSNIVATSRLLAEAGSRVSSYLIAQLVVNVIYAIPIGLGLWALGIPNALFFALVTLVLRFVPYIGSVISAALPLLMAFAESPDWSLVLWTAALFGVVELVTSNLIEPWFFGQRTGVSPLAVIVSAMFWTWLWGPMGLIIATPLTVCLVVIGHHVPSLRLFPILLGDGPVLNQSAQLYDRLLAGQSIAFTEAATSSTDKLFLAEYYDQTALPALALAQADHQAGLLSDYQAERIARAAETLTDELDQVVEDELSVASDTPLEGSTALTANGVLDGVGHSVVVIGAQTKLDDAAAMMVAQVFRAEGSEALALAHRSAMPRSIGPTLGAFSPTTAVLVSLDPSPGPAVEFLIRQLRRRLPGVRIGLAIWATAQDEAQGAGKSAADFVVTGMEALLVESFVSPDAKVA
ncbi:MAG: AI-2E family transporter [Tabrizicola sp.]|nr:AI-2E family transporter [Tabrizicola sp.]